MHQTQPENNHNPPSIANMWPSIATLLTSMLVTLASATGLSRQLPTSPQGLLSMRHETAFARLTESNASLRLGTTKFTDLAKRQEDNPFLLPWIWGGIQTATPLQASVCPDYWNIQMDRCKPTIDTGAALVDACCNR